MKTTIITICLLLACLQAEAAIIYVRTNGGTGTQCLGTTDADYDGAGSGEPCAYNHTNWPLPLQGQPTTYKAIAGDTIVLQSNSSYKLGCWNFAGSACTNATYNITNTGTCYHLYSADCRMDVIPDNVTLVGCTPTGCTDPNDRPELYGAAGSYFLVNVENSDNVIIQDIEITDHATCGINNYNACSGSMDWGRWGIYGINWTNLTLDGLWIHGLGYSALTIGQGTGITIRDTVIDKNAGAGWDGDTCGGAGTCPVSGTITLDNVQITYSGCADVYPGDTLATQGCCSQGNVSGCSLNDGIGMAAGDGDWVINDSNISHNTNDGLDLLYINNGAYDGGSVVIRRSLFEGNGGNQVKVPNPTDIQSSFIIGNCGYFHSQTFKDERGEGFLHCRAGGNTIELAWKDNSAAPVIIGNTILGNGDVNIDTTGTCTAGTDVVVKNNIIVGGEQWGGGDSTSIYFDAESGTCDTDFIENYNVCYLNKESPNCSGANSINSNPLFSGTLSQTPYPGGLYYGSTYINELSLSASSPARDAADETVSGAVSNDYNNYARGASWDIGAVEFGSTPSCSANGNSCSVSGDCCSGNCCSLTCSASTCGGGATGNLSIKGGGKLKGGGKRK